MANRYGYSNPFASQQQPQSLFNTGVTAPQFGGDLPNLAPGGPAPAQPRNPGLMQALGNFANSPGGAATIQGVGGLLAGLSQNKNAAADRAITASGHMQDAYQFEANRAKSALDADPLGATNAYAARQGFLNDLLPTLRNAQITPSDPAIAKAMPQMTGGLRLPEGGINPEALKAYSPEATAEAIARREQDLIRLDPNRRSASPLLNSLGLNVNGVGQQLNQFQNDEANRQQMQREAIRRALDNDLAGQKKKGGFWKKLGKIGAMAGIGALAPFTGGASFAMTPALLGAAVGGGTAAIS